MAGQLLNLNGSPTFIDGPDAFGSAKVNGRTRRWEWHDYLGPIFMRADGEPCKIPPGEHNPVWPHFEKWLTEYQAK